MQPVYSMVYLKHFVTISWDIRIETVTHTAAVIKLLKSKRNLLYIRNQSVPRCKHFPPRLFKDKTQSALYKESVPTAL
jgi:hypothetical protein